MRPQKPQTLLATSISVLAMFFSGLQWLLARKPEQGIELRVEGHDTRIYAAGSDPLARTPVVCVRYNYDDNEVIIYDIDVMRDASE